MPEQDFSIISALGRKRMLIDAYLYPSHSDFGNLGYLLGLAPVTFSFRHYIWQRLKTHTRDVLSFKSLEEAKPFLFLDLENPDSGGIFEQPWAKGIERRELSGAVGLFLEAEQLFTQAGVRVEAEQGTDTQLATWRQEFIDFYGEEP